MSHFTTVETQVRDIGALRGACTEMVLVLASDTEARGYGGNKLRGEYDIALNREHNARLTVQEPSEARFLIRCKLLKSYF